MESDATVSELLDSVGHTLTRDDGTRTDDLGIAKMVFQLAESHENPLYIDSTPLRCLSQVVTCNRVY